MKIFIVNYDLRNDRNYNTLYERLQNLGGIRVLESMWTLRLQDTAKCTDLRNYLLNYMDNDDGVFVAELNAYAWHNTDKEPHR